MKRLLIVAMCIIGFSGVAMAKCDVKLAKEQGASENFCKGINLLDQSSKPVHTHLSECSKKLVFLDDLYEYRMWIERHKMFDAKIPKTPKHFLKAEKCDKAITAHTKKTCDILKKYTAVDIRLAKQLKYPEIFYEVIIECDEFGSVEDVWENTLSQEKTQ